MITLNVYVYSNATTYIRCFVNSRICNLMRKEYHQKYLKTGLQLIVQNKPERKKLVN